MVIQPYLCTCQPSVEFLVIRPVNAAATVTVPMSESYIYDIFWKIKLESFGGFISHIRHAHFQLSPRLNRVEKLQI